MFFNELNGDQRRTYIDTVQVYEAYREALEERRAFQGSMYWRLLKGQNYLYHKRTQKRHECIGPRNAETEEIHRQFTEGKATASERVAALKEQLRTQGALAKALRIDRVPPIAAKLMQAINDEPDLKDKVLVIGTNALWAYEALTGVQFEAEVMATKDVDIMWDVGHGIELTGPLAGKGLVGFLKGIDKTFQKQRGMRFRAINNGGYAVDLLAPERRGERELRLVPNKADLVAQQIWALNELLEAPPIEQVVIGHLGHVVTEMRVPDPRAFVRHKLGLSKRTDREGKQRRDAMMAEAVARLVLEHLPQFPMVEGDLEGFEAPVRRELEAIA